MTVMNSFQLSDYALFVLFCFWTAAPFYNNNNHSNNHNWSYIHSLEGLGYDDYGVEDEYGNEEYDEEEEADDDRPSKKTKSALPKKSGALNATPSSSSSTQQKNKKKAVPKDENAQTITNLFLAGNYDSQLYFQFFILQLLLDQF